MDNKDPSRVKQEKALLCKELIRKHSILYTQIFTEHAADLPLHILRETQVQRYELHEFLKQKGIII